jgi:hypothetical protein
LEKGSEVIYIFLCFKFLKKQTQQTAMPLSIKEKCPIDTANSSQNNKPKSKNCILKNKNLPVHRQNIKFPTLLKSNFLEQLTRILEK